MELGSGLELMNEEVIHRAFDTIQALEPKQEAFDVIIYSGIETFETECPKPTSDPLECLICSGWIENTVSRETQGNAVLLLLSRVLKVSYSVFEQLNLTQLEGPFFCDCCLASVHEALDILRELRTLETKLSVLGDDLKRQLIKSYHQRPRPKEGQEMGQGSSRSEQEVFDQVRKVFGQCWSESSVTLQKDTRADVLATELLTGNGLTGLKKVPRADRRPRKTQPPARTVVKKEEVNDVDPGQEIRNEEFDMCREEFLEDPDHLEDSILPGKPPEMWTPSTSNLSKLGIMRISKSQRKGIELPFVCQHCGKGYKQKHFLDTHEKTHEGSATFSCILCGKEFACERHLRLHEVHGHGLPSTNKKKKKKRLIHEGSQGSLMNGTLQSFKCDYCGQEFFKKDYAQSGDSELFRFICNQEGCGIEFSKFGRFRTHHKNTCLSRPPTTVQCDVCGKQFSCDKTLKNHVVAAHTKQFEFCCELCGARKCSQGALNRHIAAHSDEKNFQCQLCQRRFKRNMQLKYHMRKHTQESLLMCGTCGKTFTIPQNLRNHELIHLNEKQFPCPICNKLFATQNYVYSHIWATHKKARQPRAPKCETAALESVTSEN